MPGFRRNLTVVAVVLSLALPLSGPLPVEADVEEAEKAMQRGIELLRDGKRQEALEAFDTAIEEAPDAWQPYFHRGRLMGTAGRFRRAREDFYTVMRLQPLLADAYSFAAFASAEMGDFSRAWDLAIAAQQLGADMSGNFRMLRQRSDPPEDLQQRLETPGLFVSEQVGIARGGGATPEDPAGRITTGDTTGGLDLGSIPRPPRRTGGVEEAAVDLARLVRRARTQVAVRPELAPAVGADDARYVLEFDVTGVDDGEPRGASGRVVVTDSESDEVLYAERFTVEDLSSEEELDRLLDEHLSRVAARIRR